MNIRKYISYIYWHVIKRLPYVKALYETRDTQTPITIEMFIIQRLLGINRRVPWPVHFTSRITEARNIYCGIETCPGYSPGCYIQAANKIYIGDYSQIGPNVGIISANHNVFDNRVHMSAKPIRIGKYCWIGMNAVILPGVELGDFTVVAAGSIVSRSFKKGYCIIGGNPASFLWKIDETKCVRHRSKYEYNGYIPSTRYEDYRKKYLNI